ncbi:MAG TPA: triose-phosphate isomerase [Fimbriimonas sp.]|nr:triose-phosphate isomerase [Fimbriimonas sp.]
MRRKLVVGNWKMNKTLAEAGATVEALDRAVGINDAVDIAICPPFTSLDCLRHLLRRSSVKLGAQDVFWKEAGAFTGSISANMLADLDCTYCIVGHSETRGRFGKLEVPESTLGYFAETDETVNLKIKALLFCSITPILCVGETLAEREAGQTDEVIRRQLEGAFAGVDGSEFHTGVVAYEPVWAIGTGQVCETPEAERVCATIRSALGEIFDENTSDAVRVLYGGSVKSSNSRDLFSQPNIDGGLVGGASLDALEFAVIVGSAK